ncbi:MAG: ATP-binding protein, partial [Acidobacteriota bacterium]
VKTSLVLTAISLSLIPVLILFPFATRLLLDAFDQWFSLPVDEVVNQAQEIASYLDEEIRRNDLRAGRRVLEQVIGYDLAESEQHVALANELQALRDELQIDYVAVFDGTSFIRGAADLSVGFRREPDFSGRRDFLQEAIREGAAWRIPEETLDVEGRLLLSACAAPRAAAAPDDADLDREPPPYTVVVTGTLLPPDIAEQSEFLRRSYQSYLQLRVQRQDLRAIFLSILLMVSLLVILAFSSIGLRLARRVTLPIQALADGTRRISEGDLETQVRVEVDDELKVLVDGFNAMTAELKRNRELVDRQHRELAQTNKRVAAVLQGVAAGVVAISSDGVILTCNGAALAILAQREKHVVGRTVEEAWSDDERGRLRELLDEDFTAGGQMRRQLQMMINGVWKTLEAKVTTLPDPDGRFGGRILVLEDLTELIYAQKMATWNEVARRIAHEIKNPLTPIQLTAERLLRKHQQQDPRLGETLEQGVATIVHEVESLKSMVDEFSRFARMPRPQPRDVDLRDLFEELARLHLGLKPGVSIETRVGDDAATVRFDPEQLKGVLINLIDNAIEATTPPGVVTLRSERDGKSLLIQVADTGRGIGPADKEKVFLPYFSTKGRGSGLGLSIVRRVVAEHNGLIHIRENQPQGSIFILQLPAS